MGFPDGAVVKKQPANAGAARDMDSIPGSGRSLGVGNGNPLQYSCLGNPTEISGAWRVTVHGVAKSRTQRNAHAHTHTHTHTHTQISDKHPAFQKVWLAGELKNSVREYVGSIPHERTKILQASRCTQKRKERKTSEVTGAALGAGDTTVKK